MYTGYEDDTRDADDEEVTPEEMDGSLRAEVLLPLGDNMVSGRVRGRNETKRGCSMAFEIRVLYLTLIIRTRSSSR